MKHLHSLTSVAAFALVSTLAAQPADRPAKKGGGGPSGPRSSGYSIAAKSLPANEREKQVLQILEEIDRTQRRGSMSVPVDDGRLLRTLAQSMGARHVVEIGTSIGYSGIWFCLALESTGGRLTTFEVDPQRAATARNNFKRAGMDRLVTLIEGDAHQEVTKIKDPIDLLFLDADKEGYVDYLQKLLPKIRPGGLVVAHNIDERQADPKFIEAVTSNPALETVLVHAGASGITISMKKR